MGGSGAGSIGEDSRCFFRGMDELAKGHRIAHSCEAEMPEKANVARWVGYSTVLEDPEGRFGKVFGGTRN